MTATWKMFNSHPAALLTGAGTALLLAAVTLYQTSGSEAVTAAETFRNARLLITEPRDAFAAPERNFFSGSSDYALLHWSGPEVSVLWDYGLSHLPGRGPDPRISPLKNFPQNVYLRINRGRNAEYAGIRSAEYHVYFRRANDPDRENILPDPVLVYKGTLHAPESQEILTLPMPDLSLSAPSDSRIYPENANLILIKIIINKIYHGSVYRDTLRLSEHRI